MFLHSGTRLEASLCWQTLAREIVAVEVITGSPLIDQDELIVIDLR